MAAALFYFDAFFYKYSHRMSVFMSFCPFLIQHIWSNGRRFKVTSKTKWTNHSVRLLFNIYLHFQAINTSLTETSSFFCFASAIHWKENHLNCVRECECECECVCVHCAEHLFSFLTRNCCRQIAILHFCNFIIRRYNKWKSRIASYLRQWHTFFSNNFE